MTQEIFNADHIKNNSSYSQSLLMEVQLPSFPLLNSNMNVDVCIVGAGVLGLTGAYMLAKKGTCIWARGSYEKSWRTCRCRVWFALSTSKWLRNCECLN